MQRGDTLSEIATRAGVSASSIRRINPSVRGNVVRAGQRLMIPNRQLPAQKYHVKGGENLTTIARKFGLSLGQLLRANPVYRSGKNVWAGAVITIPARQVAAKLGRASAAPVARSGSAPTVRTTGIRVSAASGWLWPVPGARRLRLASVAERLAANLIAGRRRPADLAEGGLGPLTPPLLLPVYRRALRRQVTWKGREYRQ